ncbi:MAG: DUF6529 family protein [Acidimicrobiia bacterium]
MVLRAEDTEHGPAAGAGGGATPVVVLAGLALVGAAVSVSLGTYGRTHVPTGGSITTFGFPSVLAMKAWLTTGAAVLALVQLASALAMFGRLPGRRGATAAWVPPAHRWAGVVAFVLTLPVAYHCLWSLGYQTVGTRQAVHSVLGCAFYGAFTTKLLALRVDGLPRFGLPVLGGLVLSLLVGLWFTSSLWFFDNFGFPY